MASINNFDGNVYSEELFSVSESDYEAVMADDFDGYPEWSVQIEADEPQPENYQIIDGLVFPVASAPRGQYVGSIEV